MNKKLMMTTAILLAFTTLSGCNIKADKRCKVTFDLNYEGAPAANVVRVEKDDYVDAPENPTRDNYFFNGWYESQDGSGNEFDFLLTPIVADLTLYADWDPAYTVTFYLNAPEQEQEVYETQVVRANALASQPANPKIARWSFGGWYGNAACDGDEFNFATSISSNLSLYAKWQEPDWSVVKAQIDKYLGFLVELYDVEVPQFPNSDYTFETYLDCVKIGGPEKCLEEYLPILTAAGYTVNEANGTAENDYVELEFNETDENGFVMYLKIKGTGESETFNPIGYQVGTYQNLYSIPDAALDLFANFKVYVSSLTTGAPCSVVYCYLPVQEVDDTREPAEYWTAKHTAFLDAVSNAGFQKGKFSNAEAYYFIDPSNLVLHQIEEYDATKPLVIELLCFNYLYAHGAGASFNKIVPDYITAASQSCGWRTTVNFDALDFSELAKDYAVNGTNFCIQYNGDAEDEIIEVCLIGVKDADSNDKGSEAIAEMIFNSINGDENWDIMEGDSTAEELIDKYYAYHYSLNADNELKADAVMTISASSSEARTKIGLGYEVDILFGPTDAEWNSAKVDSFFETQALPGDNTTLPEYEGSFRVSEYNEDPNGEYFDVYLLYADANGAAAYAQKMQSAEYGYTLFDQDDSTWYLRSASTNFEVVVYAGDGYVEIYVDCYVLKEGAFNADTLAKVNAVLNGRTKWQIPQAAVDLLTANYTTIKYQSSFYTDGEIGYSVVQFVSDITEPAASGQKTAVQNDVTAVTNYLKSQGFTGTSSLTLDWVSVRVQSTTPSAESPACLVLTITGNPPVQIDQDGHAYQYSKTKFVADNGDAFLMAYAYNMLVTEYAKQFASLTVPQSQLPSVYEIIPAGTEYAGTILNTPSLTTNARYGIYIYSLDTQIVDADGTKTTALVNAYVAALEAANFVYSNNAGFNIKGYWNSTSEEFVRIQSAAGLVRITVYYTNYLNQSLITPITSA